MEGIHLTTEQAAARLRLKPAPLKNWRSRGQGPRFVHFGRRVVYPMAEIESYEVRSLQVATRLPADVPNDRRKS